MQKLEAIPALTDNYVWGLHDGQQALVVDPGEAAPVQAWLSQHGLALTTVLITHHHPDHIGGLAALRRDRPELRVYGPVDERIPELDHACQDGDRIQVQAPAIELQVLAVPGHTHSHIAFHGDGLLYCGDTLFSAGCGRLFEGSPAQMHASLQRLAALPGATRVCCGHEYTRDNLRFARHIEPANADLGAHTDWVDAERAAGRPSLPTTIDLERRINPFLRVELAAVRQTLERERALPVTATAEDAFACLRTWKDNFRG